jgi:hypothetical protein
MLEWIRALFSGKPKNYKVFISYDHDKDKNFKHLLRAWNKNSDFDFEIDETSPKGKINSQNNHVIKSVLTRKIKQSNCVLVIVGHRTHKSQWVQWEIQQAKQFHLQLVAVKLDRQFTTPPALLKANTSWAMTFNQEAISNALNQAKNKRH